MNTQTIITTCTPFLVGILGVYYGQRIYIGQRRFNYKERQLNELYSPILGIIKEIQAKSMVRELINEKANEAWKESIKEWEASNKSLEGPNIKPYEEIINYNNAQLKEELVPGYKKIISLITENYSLADEETTKWYNVLFEFIEIWNRSLNNSLPIDVVRKLDHREAKHIEFYNHVENQEAKIKIELKPRSLRRIL